MNTIYINNNSNPIQTKLVGGVSLKMASRRFDIEMKDLYVYVYDEEEGTVTKTAITTGATSDTSYEIKSGLSVGQKIVTTPQTNYEEDTFKVRVVDKVTK